MSDNAINVSNQNSDVFLKNVGELGFTGFENYDSDLYPIPFLKIAQTQSDETQKKNPAYINGLEPGMFYNSISGKVYGENINVVLLNFEHAYMRYGQEKGSFGGKYSLDEMTLRVREGKYLPQMSNFVSVETGGKKNEPVEKCVETLALYVMLPDYPDDGVMVFSFANTGFKYAKKWLVKARAYRIPGIAASYLFAAIWSVGTLLNTNDRGSWHAIGNGTAVAVKIEASILDAKYDGLRNNILQAVSFAKSLHEKNIDFAIVD
jgi:hypothetical protein